jgi:TATA-box binding protein (TBP) (component of TFIID and TFIIIB)
MKIVNIVNLYILSKPINLELLKEKLPQIDYRKTRFNGAILKFNNVSLLIFSSGKIILTGTKTQVYSKKIINSFLDMIQDKDLYIKSRKTVNMTSSTKLPFKFNIFDFIKTYKEASWEPEIFPAMYWKQTNSNLKIIYYQSSKKLIITGAKKRKDIIDAYKAFKTETLKFKM